MVLLAWVSIHSERLNQGLPSSERRPLPLVEVSRA
jgi:hypothetical protein